MVRNGTTAADLHRSNEIAKRTRNSPPRRLTVGRAPAVLSLQRGLLRPRARRRRRADGARGGRRVPATRRHAGPRGGDGAGGARVAAGPPPRPGRARHHAARVPTGWRSCAASAPAGDIPVILLTARDRGARPCRSGLELGADDYVVKPFSPRELAARVRTVLRRSRPAGRRRATRARLRRAAHRPADARGHRRRPAGRR